MSRFCQADDIYIMMKCVSVCHVFAYFALPVAQTSWVLYNNKKVVSGIGWGGRPILVMPSDYK